MATTERNIQDRTLWEQEAILCNMVCLACGNSSLAYPDLREFEDNSVIFIEATCPRCGARICDELTQLLI
jgi:hypothetical protein